MSNSKYALITGASEGLGKEFAIIAAQDGYNLILVARNEAKLNTISDSIVNLFNVDVRIISLDLSKPNAAFELFNQVESLGLHVSMLINNAGVGDKALFSESDINKQFNMIQLNINTLTLLTRLFVTQMIAKKEGYILNIASTAAYLPGPRMSVYFASKAYVLSFTNALWYELKGTNVNVTTLSPGATNTHFFKEANVGLSSNMQKVKANPKDVAQFGYTALKQGKREVIYGFWNALTSKITGFFPERLVMWVASRIIG